MRNSCSSLDSRPARLSKAFVAQTTGASLGDRLLCSEKLPRDKRQHLVGQQVETGSSGFLALAHQLPRGLREVALEITLRVPTFSRSRQSEQHARHKLTTICSLWNSMCLLSSALCLCTFAWDLRRSTAGEEGHRRWCRISTTLEATYSLQRRL